MLIVNISTHTNTHEPNALTHTSTNIRVLVSLLRALSLSLSRPLCIYQIVAFVFFYEFAISWWRLFFKTKLTRNDLFVNTNLHLCFALKYTIVLFALIFEVMFNIYIYFVLWLIKINLRDCSDMSMMSNLVQL